MFPVSEIVFTVSDRSYPVSVIYVTYTGVGSLRGDPQPRGYALASCHAPVTAGGQPGAVTGGYPGDPPMSSFN
jgi:hypothetical protein